MQDSSIQLAEPVCAIAGVSENNYWAIVMWPCLVNVGAGTAHKNKCAWSEVKVADCVCMMLLKLAGGDKAAGKDVIVDGGKVSWAFLELASAGDEKVFS